MKFLHRFNQQKEEAPAAYSLIDVGRSTVKAVVALMEPSDTEPQIVGYGLAETGGHDVTGGRIEADVITRPVNEALTQAEDSTESYIGRKIVPDDVILCLAGRATIGKLFTVKQSRAKASEPISAKELASLRARGERLVREGLSFSSFEGGQWLPMAVTDAGRYLDGRLVLDGIGLTGSEISFSVFGVAGQASALRALEVLANRLDLAIANIVAAPHALASISPHKEAIILDIGYSGTDVCLIRNDALVATDWTPFGGHFFTKVLAREMNLTAEKATILKYAYASGQQPREDALAIDAHLDGPRFRWYDAVMEVLSELSPRKALPRRIYLTGGSSILPGLDKLLRTNPDPFGSAPEVAPLGRRSLLNVKDLTDSLDYNVIALTLGLAIGLPEFS